MRRFSKCRLAHSFALALALSFLDQGHASASPAQQTRSGPSSARLDKQTPPTSDGAAGGSKAPEPAMVTLSQGQLTVDANNSELSQILQDIARQSGMTIQGEIRSIRVFGHYGPEHPSIILSDLLSGLGYNIAMTGIARYGVPSQLVLSDRTAVVSPPAPVQPPQPTEPVLGPGAIAHPPEEEVDDPQLRNYRRDQKLQHMRDALQQQQNDAPR